MPTDTFDIAVDADDGDCNRNYTDWATVIGGDGNFVVGDTAEGTFSKSFFTGSYYVNNLFLRFDTSSIPDDATITGASLKIWVTDKGDPDGITYAADYYDFGGEPSVSADWEASSSGDCISAIVASALTTGQVNSIALTTLSGISKTGVTGIRIGPSETGAPTGDNFVSCAMHEDTTASRRPQLEVTYTLADTSQHLAPSADSVDGTWTDQAAGTALAAAIDETTPSDTDYIQSVNSPSNAGCRVKIASGSDPSLSTGHVIHWRVRKDVAGQTVDVTVKIYQGGGNVLGAGTLIATRTRSNVSTSFSTFDETLTNTEADTITNYADLYMEFYATAS